LAPILESVRQNCTGGAAEQWRETDANVLIANTLGYPSNHLTQKLQAVVKGTAVSAAPLR
jgi:hypothetical protein